MFVFEGQLVAVREDTDRTTKLPSGYLTLGVLGDGSMEVQRFYAKVVELDVSSVKPGDRVRIEAVVFAKSNTRGAYLSCRAVTVAKVDYESAHAA